MTKSRIKIYRKSLFWFVHLLCRISLAPYLGSYQYLSMKTSYPGKSREQTDTCTIVHVQVFTVHLAPPLAVHPPPYVITETASQFRRLFHQFHM